MPPVERIPPPSQSAGLLSGVFNFMSRELEAFVVNATGKQNLGQHHLHASEPRVKEALGLKILVDHARL
ncbi:hypothetical protein BD779DRAFT_590588 [Infundibulicybe gibba]|nr:hypothetical protein BD779DRAFT_590588 [Infundibulicybe gibba]